MSGGFGSGETSPVAGRAADGLIEISIIGRVRVTEAGSNHEIRFRSRKALALLCCLSVANDHAMTRDRAMELLWGSRGEEQARASLRQILHEIRSSPVGALGAIEMGRHHLSGREGAIETDLGRMIALAKRGDIDRLAQGMADCSDRMFEGLDGIDPVFDDWLRVERERQLLLLNQAVVGACAVDGGDDLGSRCAVVSALQRLNPCDEAIARLGFELDHASGDLAALHQRYRWLTAALRRDLDVEPSEITSGLFRKLTKVASILPATSERAPATMRSAMPTTAAPGEPPILAIAQFDVSSSSDEERVLATVLLAEIEFALSGLTDLRLLSVGEASQATLSALSTTSLSVYALRGSVRINGDELHLGWRLSRARDGLILWTHRTIVAREGTGAAVDGIVAQVAGAVLPTLERDIDTDPIDPDSTSGYGIYLQGRARGLSATSLAQMKEAAELFERAIASAPRLINAQLSLARLYNTDYEQWLSGHDKEPLRRRAFELCSRAVTVDPRSAQARARLGWCYMRRGDLVHATSQFEEALSLNPYHADCLNEIGVAFGHIGDLDRAMALLTRAFEINPFPRDDYFCDMAILHLLRGHHKQAEENFEIAHNDGLHYTAFRLANRGLMGGSAVAEIDDLRRRFRATWIRSTPPRDDDLIDAIFDYIPLQRQEHRALVTQGLHQLGFDTRSF